MWGADLKVIVLEVCLKEIKSFPTGIKEEIVDLIHDLEMEVSLSMPISRRMEGMGKGVFELRLSNKDGTYRLIYLIKKKDAIYLIHAFQKKTNKTPKKSIDVAKKRIKSIL